MRREEGSLPEEGSHPTEGDGEGDDPQGREAGGPGSPGQGGDAGAEGGAGPGGRSKKRRRKKLLDRLPASERIIRKFTGRDVAEAFIGGVLFSLPLLVEDGVFEIAEWFAAYTVGPVPVFLTLNILLIVGLVTGLLYYTDIRDIQVRLLFGFVPKRLVGILTISFIVAAGSMFLWGRLHEEDPTTLERMGRIAVIWAPAALGATLADILPGESKGADLVDMITDAGPEDGEEYYDDV